ncbi:HAD family hydrolase [Arcticibacter sp. MXS-1]|uniref:HAD family hydrolase n=1 Tax=Arcticibacter sp. MXS-1 TaxID=3341726 RepID=UPI0035A93DD6
MKQALILDLDNTIYPVRSIGEELFAPLFELMNKHKGDISKEDFEQAREDIMRRPFQKVAQDYHFSNELTQQGLELLRNATYEGPMAPFPDYQTIKSIRAEKFLVTTGFLKLQSSKVDKLGIRNDFREIYIIDPDTTEKTKKDIFADILEKYGLQAEEVLVVGDDPESEIEAAAALRIDSFLYDPEERSTGARSTYRGRDFQQLLSLFSD